MLFVRGPPGERPCDVSQVARLRDISEASVDLVGAASYSYTRTCLSSSEYGCTTKYCMYNNVVRHIQPRPPRNNKFQQPGTSNVLPCKTATMDGACWGLPCLCSLSRPTHLRSPTRQHYSQVLAEHCMKGCLTRCAEGQKKPSKWLQGPGRTARLSNRAGETALLHLIVGVLPPGGERRGVCRTLVVASRRLASAFCPLEGRGS